jgi:hypothetical protein
MAVVALGFALLAGGCEDLGLATYLAHGPAPVEPQYVPYKEPMLVLVECYGSTGSVNVDVARLSSSLVKELQDNKVAPIIDPNKLVQFRDKDPEGYSKMGITDIGRKLGARQVLYVNVTYADLDVPGDTPMIRGTISATVRIVDADSALTRWPASPQDGMVVNAKSPWIRTDESNAQTDAHNQMTDTLATRIGNLFHEWQPEHDIATDDDQNQSSPY